ncbi:M15 family metallopeptidase [Paenibacillus alkalitolerans]|uniref:M15 family metallopeptidase n=1 Tax=Paenibacillus alkalitolerans TaxID=2799335 RepID=UPI0018F7470B|nr:M15 family metallopeptidase [Paenibacillus alkalitolerans]
MRKATISVFGLAVILIIAIAAFNSLQINASIKDKDEPASVTVQSNKPPVVENTTPPPDQDAEPPHVEQPSPEPDDGVKNDSNSKSENVTADSGQLVVEPATAAPESIAALVNKQYALPEDYEPSDLVYPDVDFTFDEKIDKRKLRKVAADALEEMFEAAKEDGIFLAGVSGYRSHDTQKALFNRYVKKDGLENARRYSAEPGHSEHQTGLAIDVSGSNGKCAAQDCFAGTKEAEWLEKHAAEYGFIIRYPKEKESITGYKYEPWHLRYIGVELALSITSQGITLEEYYNAAVPVSNE